MNAFDLNLARETFVAARRAASLAVEVGEPVAGRIFQAFTREQRAWGATLTRATLAGLDVAALVPAADMPPPATKAGP